MAHRMPVELQTIEGVELVATGTYNLASGETTFTAEDLAAAVAASQDATVPAPRVKLGHDDPRFDEAVASGHLGGEPAFGTVQNMRLSADGQTLLGDLVDVPSWLADSMQSSYPGRSIEGGFGFEAPSGRSYEFVISALALLGVTWPGVTSLADLREILERNDVADLAEVAVAAGIGDSDIRRVTVQAGLDADLVRRRFCEMLDDGTYDVPDGASPSFTWWPRSLRFEDDGHPVLIAEDGDGNLYRITFTVSGNDVAFEAAERVVEQYVPVKAGAARPPRAAVVAASWTSSVEARAHITTHQETSMTDEQRRNFALSLGLPEDTDEATLYAQAAERAAAPPEADVVETPPAPVIPEGMALVDQATLDEIRDGAAQGVAVAAQLAAAERTRIVTAAIEQGRIPVSRREHYEAMFAADREGATRLLTASIDEGGLAPGLIPTALIEAGHAGDGEAQAATADQDHSAYMQRHFPQSVAAANANKPGLTVRTEV